MSLRRVSLLLVVAFFLATDSCGVRSSRRSLSSPGGHETGIVGRPATQQLSAARGSSISPFSTWRYRLKSVLQETDYRIIREAHRGPVPMPETSFASDAQTPRVNPFWTVVPLRC